MINVKLDVRSVLKDELTRMYHGKGLPHSKAKLIHEIINNDNILQEMENVVHSFSQEIMKRSNNVNQIVAQRDDLEHRLINSQRELKAHKDEVELVRERNNRMHVEVKKLQDGIIRDIKKKDRCDHVQVMKEDDGVVVESLIRMREVSKGTYQLSCSKCHKLF